MVRDLNFGEEVGFIRVNFYFDFLVFVGEIQQRGNVLPFAADIYRPMLSRLRAEGLESFETSKWL